MKLIIVNLLVIHNLKHLRTCSMLLISAIIFSLSGYAQAGKNTWSFSSGKDYCRLKTTVHVSQKKNSMRKPISFSIIYAGEFDSSDACVNSIFVQNEITTIVSTSSYRKFNKGTHALFQSQSLINEQAPLLQPEHQCKVGGYYAPDYRMNNLLLSALSEKEDIRLTTNFQRYGELTGLIHIDGFDSAYEKMLNCMDDLQN